MYGSIVDGRNPANQLRLVVYPHYLHGFIHHSKCVSSQEGNTSEFCRGFVLMRVSQHFYSWFFCFVCRWSQQELREEREREEGKG